MFRRAHFSSSFCCAFIYNKLVYTTPSADRRGVRLRFFFSPVASTTPAENRGRAKRPLGQKRRIHQSFNSVTGKKDQTCIHNTCIDYTSRPHHHQYPDTRRQHNMHTYTYIRSTRYTATNSGRDMNKQHGNGLLDIDINSINKPHQNIKYV